MPSKLNNLFEVLKVSTKLGLTSFGGPIAHLAYFHNEYVKRRILSFDWRKGCRLYTEPFL